MMPSMAFNISSITRTKMVANRKLARLDAHWTSNDFRSKACLGLAVLAGQVPWVKKLDGIGCLCQAEPQPFAVDAVGGWDWGLIESHGRGGLLKDPVPNGFRWLELMAELALRKTCAAVSVLSALYSVVFWFGKLVFWTSWWCVLSSGARGVQLLAGLFPSIHSPVWLVGAQCLACHFGLN